MHFCLSSDDNARRLTFFRFSRNNDSILYDKTLINPFYICVKRLKITFTCHISSVYEISGYSKACFSTFKDVFSDFRMADVSSGVKGLRVSW